MLLLCPALRIAFPRRAAEPTQLISQEEGPCQGSVGAAGPGDPTSTGACPQQVNNVLVVSQVTHDLQLRHESILLVPVC